MIVSIFLTFVNGFVNLVLGALPAGHLPAIMTTGFAYFLGVANLFSYVVPVGHLLLAMTVVLAFDAAVLAWNFIQWVLKKIPFLHMS